MLFEHFCLSCNRALTEFKTHAHSEITLHFQHSNVGFMYMNIHERDDATYNWSMKMLMMKNTIIFQRPTKFVPANTYKIVSMIRKKCITLWFVNTCELYFHEDTLIDQLYIYGVNRMPILQFPRAIMELTLKVDEHVNYQIKTLPKYLEKLRLDRVQCDFKNILMPENLNVLTLINYNYKIEPHTLPSNLSVLDIGHAYTHDLKGVIPLHIRRLILGDAYNHSLQLSAYVDLHTLIIGHGFNQCIKAYQLHHHLQILHIGNGMNQELNFDFHSRIRELRIGSSFNQPLLLPLKLKTLIFDEHSHFEHDLFLPATLTYVVMGQAYEATRAAQTFQIHSLIDLKKLIFIYPSAMNYNII